MFPNLIPTEYEDKMFLLASEMIYDKKNKIWTIVLESGKELVVLNSNVSKEFPTVADIRNYKPEVYENNDKVYYKGGSLFSTGVILIVNDKIVMLQRDKNVPTDPEKWTSPAGRCDAMPKDSSLKEFYEELIAFDKDGVVFFNIPGVGQKERDIYDHTILRKKEKSLSIKEVQCKIDKNYSNCEINIRRENNIFSGGSFWFYYDIANNTLELRIICRATIDTELMEKICFEDGELYNRVVDTFLIEQLNEISLVPTMEAFRNKVTEVSKNKC